MPVAALGGLDRELHLLAQTRACGARIDLEFVNDLEPVVRGLIERGVFHILDVEFALEQRIVAVDLRRLVHHHGELGERLAHTHLLRLAQ